MINLDLTESNKSSGALQRAFLLKIGQTLKLVQKRDMIPMID